MRVEDWGCLCIENGFIDCDTELLLKLETCTHKIKKRQAAAVSVKTFT